MAGTATDQTFPVTPGAYDTSFNGETDAFVAKLVSQRAGIVLDPESGPPGSTVQITGDGFASGELVHLSFVDTQSGRMVSLGDVTAHPSGAFVASEQRFVTGLVRVKLFEGQATVVDRKSEHILYSKKLATYETGDQFDHDAAKGFIRLHGLGQQTQAHRQLP